MQLQDAPLRPHDPDLARRSGGDVPRYDSVAIALHWVIAALVLTLLALGVYMTDLPRNTPERAFAVNLHKSLGVLTLMLVVLRLGWRLTHAPPPLPATIPAWRRRAALVSHGLLYAVMLMQPVTGYLMSSFGEYGIRFFGIPLPTVGSPDAVLREKLATLHRSNAVVLIALVIVHIFAAVQHGMLARDGVLQRILPQWARPRGPARPGD